MLILKSNKRIGSLGRCDAMVDTNTNLAFASNRVKINLTSVASHTATIMFSYYSVPVFTIKICDTHPSQI